MDVKSRRDFSSGVGHATLAALDAVRRRWCCDESSCEGESGLLRSFRASMTPLSRMETSSESLLVSLLATFTAKSDSPIRRPGVIGDGSEDGWSVVVGDVTLTGGVGEDGGGNGSSGENSPGVGR